MTSTMAWFKKAIPEPTSKNLHTQIGCHFEEVGEMLESIITQDAHTATLLVHAEASMKALATWLKMTDKVITIPPVMHHQILDALCDQVVTASGTAYMLGFQFTEAMDEVNGSNWSKFVEGAPIFDANRKIQKGPHYYKADLTRFLPEC